MPLNFPEPQFVHLYNGNRGFPSGSPAKNPPAMHETWVLFLGREDPLEKEMATHSILAWEILWKEEPGRLHAHGVGHKLQTKPPSQWE